MRPRIASRRRAHQLAARAMRHTVKGVVTIKSYPVVERAVEEGVGYGWRRAHKHTVTPTEDAVQTEIVNAVMNSLCEVLEF